MSNRLAWDNRWSEPTLEHLLNPLKAQPRRLFDQIMGQLAELPGVDRRILWHGPSWKWTIEYTLRDPKGKHLEHLCYLVPNHQNPLICVPLSDAVLEKLPLKKLNRFIRDGIASAKCAVSIHWAIFAPSTLAETAFLYDLIQRKHHLLTAPSLEGSSNPVGAVNPGTSSGKSGKSAKAAG